MKPRILLTILAVLGLTSAAPALAQKYSPQETIVYSHLSNVGPLNPHMYSPNQMFGQAMVYDSLVKLNHDGSLGPSLAESWTISEDGRVYTFKLRPDVVFSDGQPFNAEAAVKNFAAIMGNRARHLWLGLAGKIEGFEATGPYEFTLTLSSAYYPTLDDLSMTRPFRMLSPAAFPDDGDTSKGIKAPVGTGPWKLTEVALGRYDLFERNEKYWGEKPGAAKVLVKVIPDPVSRALAFETGEIDLIYGMGQINFDTFDRLRKTKGVGAAISSPMGTMALALNSASGPTSELAVRRAIQHLTNKKALVKGVTLDTQPLAETLFYPKRPYCDLGLAPYAFDVAKAGELLDQAGWILPAGKKIREKNGAPLVVDLCFVGNDAAHKAIAEVLQAQGLAAGVSFNLLGEEPDSFYRRQKEGDFGLIVNTTWGPPSEPHAMVSSMLLPSHADFMAQSGLTMKDEIDEKIRQVLVSTDEASRAEYYRWILTTLHEQAVYLPIYYLAMFEAHRDGRLQDVNFGPDTSKIPFEQIVVQ